MIRRIIQRLDTAHMSLGCVVLAIGTILNYFNHLNADYVAFATAVLSYFGAHLYIKNGRNDDDSNDSGSDSTGTPSN